MTPGGKPAAEKRPAPTWRSAELAVTVAWWTSTALTTVMCQECGVAMPLESPVLRVELVCDDDWVVYCEVCWKRELGGDT